MPSKRVKELCKSILHVVRERLRDNKTMTVAAIADQLGYTRQYVSRMFRILTGRAISEYLRRKRLRKAASLLASPIRRPVAEIAASSGFASVNQFRKAFKALYGVPPVQFRAARKRRRRPHKAGQTRGPGRASSPTMRRSARGALHGS